ncbi:type VI secretion system baseplate subunit TssF [Dyella kyungheensis]|uniref:Type VI secretion system baseplate subunit TssF n=1 Tax=Dyella kyungheensis TaxID=1242174 RepID=A0ABS2JWC9_9GAMM|nr:type VI secretion system baseplate subunit TssF [Dyella kyungheensis]MBM7123321.1 type VI secretion system baseplate subunit TssF [Dyella kyungheensis]
MSLRHKFREEMDYLRRLGREFSKDNPQLARFLGEEAADPDVERLLEGFAFLTAKLRLKIEDDFPELTHTLLQLLWPNYLRPLPSSTIMCFEPVDHAITQRQVIPKGARMLSRPVEGVQCEFRTCTDVVLYPFRLHEVSDAHTREKSIVRIELSTTTDNALDTFDCDQLDFHLSGDESTARTLYLWLAKYLGGVTLVVDDEIRQLSAKHVSFPGFSPEEALLPYPKNVFDGYRILQEYFIFPQRFHFFCLQRLRSVWPARKASRVRLEFHFSRPMPANIRLRTGDIALYCAPAVNLFAHDAEPIQLEGRAIDEQLLPSGHRLDACEIFSIDEVASHQRKPNGERGDRLRTFYPFESLQHEIEHAHGRTSLYYRTRIQQSLTDAGIHHRIAFVRGDETAFIGQGETVSLALTCTNRDLPLALGVGDICMPTQTTPMYAAYRNIIRPTPSYRPVLDGSLLWTLVSNLSLNYLSLLSAEPLKAVVRAYDFAALHDIQHARATRKRLSGVHEAVTTPADVLMKGLPIRGLKTQLTLDQAAFLCEGDLYLFATVLSHFFALYASINSFHQLDVLNASNNERYQWPWLIGKQPQI